MSFINHQQYIDGILAYFESERCEDDTPLRLMVAGRAMAAELRTMREAYELLRNQALSLVEIFDDPYVCAPGGRISQSIGDLSLALGRMPGVALGLPEEDND